MDNISKKSLLPWLIYLAIFSIKSPQYSPLKLLKNPIYLQFFVAVHIICLLLLLAGWLLICLARLRRKFCALLEHFSCRRVSSVFCPRLEWGTREWSGIGCWDAAAHAQNHLQKGWLRAQRERDRVFCVVTGIAMDCELRFGIALPCRGLLLGSL